MMLGEETKTGPEDLSHDAAERSLMCGTTPAPNRGKSGAGGGGGDMARNADFQKLRERMKNLFRDKLKRFRHAIYLLTG